MLVRARPCASLLVGASSVGASIVGAGLAATAGGYLHLAAAIALLVAAGIGIVALRPRRGSGVDLYGL